MKRITFKKVLTTGLALLCLITGMAQKKQRGKASYYSKRATGARTASGQRLHHDSLTCAHKFYPFGTHLKVTNLSNNKSVIVKVIDRGPYRRGRIIDLSWAAAKEIDMLAQGVASVKIELAERPIPFRPEEEKIPQIDFEVAESDYVLQPNWNSHNKKKNATAELASSLKEGHRDKLKEGNGAKLKENASKLKEEADKAHRKEKKTEMESKNMESRKKHEHKLHKNK